VVANNCVFCGKKHFNSHLLVTVMRDPSYEHSSAKP
jgi:hypothetical protein